MIRCEKQVHQILLFHILVVFVCFLALPSFAAFTTFEKEYTYQASEADSKLSSRAIAVEQIKRLLLEELGSYLEAKTEVKNYMLTKDQITVLTAGIVKTDIIGERWDGKTYYLKAQISADPDDVAKRVDALRKDLQKTDELETTKKRTDDLLSELEKLKGELRTLKTANKVQKQLEIDAVISGLNAKDWYEKGWVLVESDNFNAAVEALNKSIQLDSKNPLYHLVRGNIYFLKIDDLKKALSDYDRAITLNPGYAAAYYYRGILYAKLGHNKALRDRIPNKVFWDSLDKLQQTKEQSTMLEKRLKGEDLKILLAKSEDYKKGLDDLSKAIELNPKHTDAYLARAGSYIALGDYQKGIKDYNRVVELDPKSVDAFLFRARSYSLLGNDKQALSDFDKAIEINPNDARIYINRADYYLYSHAVHSEERRFEDLIKATELDPQNSVYYLVLGSDCISYGMREKNPQKTGEGIKALKISARLGNKDAQNTLKEINIDW